MRHLRLALLIIVLTPAPAVASSDSCTRILVTDEYGRAINHCRDGQPAVMSGTQIIELVRAALAARGI